VEIVRLRVFPISRENFLEKLTMKKAKWLLCAVLLPVILLGAGSDDASKKLEAQLEHAEGKDRANILYELTRHYFGDTDSKCLVYGNQTVRLARRLQLPMLEAKTLKIMGYYLGQNHQKEKSIELLSKSLEIMERVGQKQDVIWLLFVIGEIARDFYPGTAGKSYERALSLMEEIDDQLLLAHLNNSFGAICWDIGLNDRALRYYFKSKTQFRNLRRLKLMANVMNNIGMAYAAKGDLDKAMSYYRKSLDIRIAKNEVPQGIAASFNNIGLVYLERGDFDRALEWFEKSLKIRKKEDLKIDIIKSLSNIGRVYEKKSQPGKAMQFYESALELSTRIDDKRGLAKCLHFIGEHHENAGDSELAETFYLRSLKISSLFKIAQYRSKNLENLMRVHQRRGDYKNALFYSNVINRDQKNKNDEMDWFEDLLKEKNALLRKNEIQKLETRNMIVIGIAVILLLTALSLLFFRQYRFYKDELIRKEERQKRLELESQLKLFQARINPHFLFNSLDSIRELGYTGDPDEVERVVMTLSDMYRRILTSPADLLVPLENEILIIRDYLEIEKRMQNGRLDYSLSIDDSLFSFEVLPLTIEPLVENSVTHGIAPKESGELNIDIGREEDFVVVEIRDDGIGFDMNDVNPGFGLFSVQERLKLFYREKAGFKINSIPGQGTQIIMRLPYAVV
jgi:tetratricopeptide (TPR) repeat protein